MINKRTQELSLLSKDDIDQLAAHFDESKPYDEKNGMKKVHPAFGKNLIESIVNLEGYQWIGGNFYEHVHPYFPHVDKHKMQEGNVMVMVIPIRYTGRMPNLIIFDQEYYEGPYTWLMDWKRSEGSQISKFDTNRDTVSVVFEKTIESTPIRHRTLFLDNNQDIWFTTFSTQTNKSWLYKNTSQFQKIQLGIIGLFQLY